MIPLSILIISERPEAALLEQMLTKISAGNTCTIAHSSATIIQVLNNRIPDIIFCDWLLNSITPATFCKNLTSDEHFSQVFFVALLDNNDELHHAYACGAHEAHTFEVNKLAYYKIYSIIASVAKCKQLRRDNTELLSRLTEHEEAQLHYVNTIQRTLFARFPELEERSPFIERATIWITEQLTQEDAHKAKEQLEMQQILFAAKLYPIGRMHLPDGKLYASVSFEGRAADAIMAHVPLEADMIIGDTAALDGARNILRNMYENYDGTGFPDRKQHWQIPVGSRVLRAVVEFDELLHRDKKNKEEALAQLKRFVRHVYDHRVVALLEEYLNLNSGNSKTQSDMRPVQLHELSEGMKLARDIITNSGLKLIPAGTTLRESLIARILSHNSMDPVLGNIYVRC